jgi:hypothetical protein
VADDVIVNDSDVSALRDAVEKLHAQYLEIAARRLRPATA